MNSADLPEDSTGQKWEQGWDGHERQQRLRLANLSLPEKLLWLEEAHRLVRRMASQNPKPQGNHSEPDR